MELLAKIVSNFQSLTVFSKSSILAVWQVVSIPLWILPKIQCKKVQVFHNVQVLIYSFTLLYLTNRRSPSQMFHRIAALKKCVKYRVQNTRWNMELMDGTISSAKWYPFLSQAFCLLLTLSWWRSLPYKNQFIDLQSKSTNWFLYERGLRDERVKGSCFGDYSKMTISK